MIADEDVNMKVFLQRQNVRESAIRVRSPHFLREVATAAPSKKARSSDSTEAAAEKMRRAR
jgi:hypothetical protein